MAIQYYSPSAASEKIEEVDEEEQLMWRSEHSQIHTINESEDGEEIEDELIVEDASSMSSSPSIPDENINFDLVYALHTFVATVEGQASVVKGDALILMEDTNIYWWLVEVLKTREIGYIPAENIETPYERLARLNKHRNVEITSPSTDDIAPSPVTLTHPLNPPRRVTIGDESLSKIFHYEVESEIDEEEERFDEVHYDEEDNTAVYRNSSDNEFQEMVMDDHESASNKQEWQEKNWNEEQGPQTEEDKTLVGQPEEPKNGDEDIQSMELRVFAGNIGQGPLFNSFTISLSTTADELLRAAVSRFGMMVNTNSEDTTIEYYIAVQGMDGDEYVLAPQDKPCSIFKTLTDSLTTPMPSLSHIRRISQQSFSSINSTSRRPRSSSFSNYEQTTFDEDSVIRFYLHRRIKRAHEREGLLYIKVSLYPDESSMATSSATSDVSTPTAFTNNPTPTKSKKKQRISSRSEIDRIDKIISVRQEFPIGAVINLALEKFHVPDAQADDYPGKLEHLRDSRQLGKYRMSVRGNGQEIELNPHELMSNVLLQQQTSSPNHSGPITSDLLFVLRKAGSTQKKSLQNEAPLPRVLGSEDRRPSILDILMDNTPKMGDRRPSTMGSLLEPPPRLMDDNRRPSGSNTYYNSSQERKSSLNQQQHSPTSSSSSFPISKSSNSKLPSNQSISSASLEERTNNSDMENLDTIRQTPSINTERKKESFKQQFKRLVGWGKNHANSPPPLTTSPISKTTADINSPSEMSFVSAPSTPVPPTPLSIVPNNNSSIKIRQNQPEMNTPVSMSCRASETTGLNDPSTTASIVAASVVSGSSKRLSIASSISSTSSVTSEELAAATAAVVEDNEGDQLSDSELEVEQGNDNDSQKEEVHEEPVEEEKSSMRTLPSTLSDIRTNSSQIEEESNDIQTQYAMWMNSQTDAMVPEEENTPINKNMVINSAISTKAPLNNKSQLRNKSSTISNATTANSTSNFTTTSPSISSTVITSKTEVCEDVIQKVDVTIPPPKEEEYESLHPMPANNEQELDDLFLLVAHGVDFLTTKENTKWEEEGGYDFHPWNRPQSSFAVRHQDHQRSKENTPLPQQLTNNEGNPKVERVNDPENTSAALAMARSLLLSPTSTEESKPISPPLTPLPQAEENNTNQQESASAMAKRVLGATKPEIQPTLNQPQQQQIQQVQSQPQHLSLDDEELQRIVAAHIVF